jgi:hypothetical protein
MAKLEIKITPDAKGYILEHDGAVHLIENHYSTTA